MDESSKTWQSSVQKETIMQILKSAGYCSDGMHTKCDFFSYGFEPTREFLDGQFLTKRVMRCKHFNDIEITEDKGSLICCNKIYGFSYEGRP
jgi:hypothetical protein